MFLLREKLIDSFYNCKPNDFFELQMKELLENVEETWEVIHKGPENEILRHYAEESKILTTRYASKLLVFYNN